MPLKGYQQLSGTHGYFWLNGEQLMEVASVEAKVVPQREDVQLGLDVDSKIVSLKGEGSFKLLKFYSRGKKELINAWRRGEDPRMQFVSAVKDPGAVGKQTERVVINGAWLNEVTLTSWERGARMEEEYPFGFPASELEIPDEINPT